MPGQYNLDKGGVGRDEYAKLLADAMQRYGGDRDRAVRSANVAGGFGSSTAQRFMHGGGARASTPGGSAGPKGGGGRPKQAAPQDLSGPATGAPLPIDRAFGSPDLAVSPQRPPDMMWQGATANDRLPQNAVPPNSAMSLASILRGVPPELMGRQATPPPNLGLPPFWPPIPWGQSVPPELMGRPARPGGNNGGYPAAGVYG